METFGDSVRIERFLHGLRSHIVLVVAALAVVLPDLVYASDDQRIMMGVSCINAIESAFVSKGMTCHDGAVWNPFAMVSDFRIGETCVPAFIGFWGMFSLFETDKFPQEKP